MAAPAALTVRRASWYRLRVESSDVLPLTETRPRTRATATLLLLVVVAASAPARAEGPADVARRHAEEGVRLFKQDEYGPAVEHLLEAEKALVQADLEVPPLIFAAIARCYDQLGQIVPAMGYYTRFLSVANRNDRALAETVQRAVQSKKRPQSQLDNTALRFEVTPDGAEVRLDRRTVGRTPLDVLKVNPGPHQVTFWAEGYEPNSVDVDVAAGATVPVVVALVRKRKAAPKPAPAPPPKTPTAGPSRWMWWAGGGAAALVIAATVTAVLLWPEDQPDTHAVRVSVQGR